MLAVLRHLPEQWSSVRERRWKQGVSPSGIRELTGKTIGIVGFGRIGREVAKRLKGFDVRMLCYDTTATPPAIAAELGVTCGPLEVVLREADIVTLHVPL